MMSESKHTPGPWGLSDNGFGIYGPEPDEWGIAYVNLYDSKGAYGGLADDEQKANARLMAAAPDLLRYAERALDWITNQREEDCWCYDEVDGAPDSPPPGRCLACHLREAIRKATEG